MARQRVRQPPRGARRARLRRGARRASRPTTSSPETTRRRVRRAVAGRAAERLRGIQAGGRARPPDRASRGPRRAYRLGVLAARPQLPADDAAPRCGARRAARGRRPGRLPDGDRATSRARRSSWWSAARPGSITSQGADRRAGSALRARSCRRPGWRRVSSRCRPANCSARRRVRPARSCEPSTRTLHGCHTGETGCVTVSPPWRQRREREAHPRHRRLRLHRLAFRPAPADRHADARGRQPRRADLRRQPGEPGGRRRRPALPLRARRDRRRRRGGRGRRGLRRDRQLRRRDARRPLDHRGRRLHPDQRPRHARLLEQGPRARRPPAARLDRRGVRRHRGPHRSRRGRPAAAVLAVLGLEGRRRAAGARLRAHLRRRRR